MEDADGVPWCEGTARDACQRDALATSGRIEYQSPDKCEGYALHARARIATRDVAGGLTELEKASESVSDHVSCLKQLADIARKAGSESRSDAALERIIAAGCNDEVECSQNLRWAGSTYEWTGRANKALALYRRAYEQVPDDDLLAHMAALAKGVSLHGEAARDYELLARHHPENETWHHLAASEHDAAMREAERL